MDAGFHRQIESRAWWTRRVTVQGAPAIDELGPAGLGQQLIQPGGNGLAGESLPPPMVSQPQAGTVVTATWSAPAMRSSAQVWPPGGSGKEGMFDVGGPVERSLCRRGQFLVVVGALLGALIGVVLGLAVEDSQTPTAVAAPGGHVARRWPPIRRAASPPHPRRLVAGIEPMAMGPPTASALSRRTDPTTGMATPARTSPARVNTARARTSRPQPAAPPTQRARVGAAARRSAAHAGQGRREREGRHRAQGAGIS
jgi:hypothetical protein